MSTNDQGSGRGGLLYLSVNEEGKVAKCGFRIKNAGDGSQSLLGWVLSLTRFQAVNRSQRYAGSFRYLGKRHPESITSTAHFLADKGCVHVCYPRPTTFFRQHEKSSPEGLYFPNCGNKLPLAMELKPVGRASLPTVNQALGAPTGMGSPSADLSLSSRNETAACAYARRLLCVSNAGSSHGGSAA